MKTVEEVKVSEFEVTESKWSQFKAGLSRHKGKVMAGAMAGATAVYAGSPASAAGETGMSAVTTSIDTQMASIQSAAMLILGSIAGVAITLFAGVFVWKYGKKIFSVISK